MSLEMMIGCTGDACSDWVRRRNLPSILNMVNNATNSQSLLQLRSDIHSLLNIVTAPHTIVGQLAVVLHVRRFFAPWSIVERIRVGPHWLCSSGMMTGHLKSRLRAD